MSATTVKEAVFGRTGKAIAVAALCACAGLGAWVAMMNLGFATTTAMGNIFNWGLLIAVFAFLVGFGAGAQLVASGIVLFGRPESQRLVLPLQACGLGAVIGAAVAVMADLGSPFHIFAMVLHPNPASPLAWDMVALTAFIVLAFVGLLAVARGWRSRRVWMAVAGVAAVALQVVEAFRRLRGRHLHGALAVLGGAGARGPLPRRAVAPFLGADRRRAGGLGPGGILLVALRP